jgi:hypothetical protein
VAKIKERQGINMEYTAIYALTIDFLICIAMGHAVYAILNGTEMKQILAISIVTYIGFLIVH